MNKLTKDEIESILPHLEHQTKKSTVFQAITVLNSFRPFYLSKLDIEGTEKISDFPNLNDIINGKECDTAYVGISRHLSELDWVLLLSTFYNNNKYSIVHSGDNLIHGKWGELLRKGGASSGVRNSRQFMLADGNTIHIDRTIYQKEIFPKQLENILDCSPWLVFPEYQKIKNKKIGKTERKAGRSYTGELLQFSPFIFTNLLDYQKNSGKKVVIIPIGLSYERVFEDSNFKNQANIKDDAKKVDQDFKYIIKQFGKRRDASIVFGETYELSSSCSVRKSSKIAKETVGDLSRVHAPHIVFYSLKDGLDGNKIFGISLGALKNKMEHVLDSVYITGGLSDKYFSSRVKRMDYNLDEIIKRTAKVYKELVGIEGNQFIIYNANDRGEITQSINQAKHIIEK